MIKQEIDAQDILGQFKRWEEVGLLDYVLPTTPLGEAWVVGYKGEILRFPGNESAIAYLLGLNAGALYMASRVIPGILAQATAEAEGAALHLSEDPEDDDAGDAENTDALWEAYRDLKYGDKA